MNNVQFAFMLIGGLGGFLGAAWIIAQAIQKTAMNPVYDEKFANGNDRMDRLETALIDLRTKVEQVPERTLGMLRNMGFINNQRGP